MRKAQGQTGDKRWTLSVARAMCIRHCLRKEQRLARCEEGCGSEQARRRSCVRVLVGGGCWPEARESGAEWDVPVDQEAQ
jgi:hypothetical protein